MDIAQDIKDRITVAANALYEELARSEFPTVAAVRSRAATDMNAASIVMRQWRRAQTTQSAPVAVDIPDQVRTAHGVALATLWAEAQALANTGLSMRHNNFQLPQLFQLHQQIQHYHRINPTADRSNDLLT